MALPQQLARMASSRIATLDFVIEPVTPLPDEVIRRFPSMREWHEKEEERRRNLEKVVRELVTALREAKGE